MDILINVLIFVVSLTALIKGADFFVSSAEKIGLSFGISPFVIGATIVGFGTSLPELASSIAAVYAGASEMIVGNVIGSNVFNISAALALVAIVSGNVKLEKDIMTNDIPMLVFSSMLMYFVLYDFHISYFESFILIAGVVIFLLYTLKDDEDKVDKDKRPKAISKDYLILAGGMVMVYFGAIYTIDSVVFFAEKMNVSTHLIGLTVVAFGTSLPEIVVSLAAARQGNASMAVGNVLGSNIFNSFAVLGIPRFFGDIEINHEILKFSLPFMVSLTVLLAIISISKRITRWEGWLMLLAFAFYIVEVLKNV